MNRGHKKKEENSGTAGGLRRSPDKPKRGASQKEESLKNASCLENVRNWALLRHFILGFESIQFQDSPGHLRYIKKDNRFPGYHPGIFDTHTNFIY